MSSILWTRRPAFPLRKFGIRASVRLNTYKPKSCQIEDLRYSFRNILCKRYEQFVGEFHFNIWEATFYRASCIKTIHESHSSFITYLRQPSSLSCLLVSVRILYCGHVMIKMFTSTGFIRFTRKKCN